MFGDVRVLPPEFPPPVPGLLFMLSTRKQRAVAAGGRGAAAAGMQAHPGHAEVQRVGQMVIDGLRE